MCVTPNKVHVGAVHVSPPWLTFPEPQRCFPAGPRLKRLFCGLNASLSRSWESTGKGRTSSAWASRRVTWSSGDSAPLAQVCSAPAHALLMLATICSYQLGSGEAHILSREAVNDGRWHKVTAVRYGSAGAARGSHGNPDSVATCGFVQNWQRWLRPD